MKLYPTIFLVCYATFAYCQSTIDNFKNYDIRNSSCEVINAVNVEFLNSSYKEEYLKLLDEQNQMHLHSSESAISDFIDDFNSALDKTKKQYEAQEFLWKTNMEIGKYGLSVLSNYAQALPSKYLTNFLTPTIQQGFERYVSTEIEQGVEKHQTEIDKLIKDRIDLLYSNSIDVRTASDEEAFRAMFEMAHGDIPALDREHYGAFNKVLTKRAYDFIERNRSDIRLLDLKTIQQYEQVRKDVDEKIETYQKQVTEDVNSKFNELGNSIAVLIENQEIVFNRLDNIQRRVVDNERRIEVLELDMGKSQNDIIRLKGIQDEHSILLAQNAFQIEILSGYTFQNLNTDQKLNALRKGDFDNIFRDEEGKRDLIEELEDIKDRETIISVSKTVEGYSQSVYGVLISSRVLKGKDAENVGKFIHGVSIASGIARVFASDFSGFTSIIAGIGGLVGKPQPSPEMQMLKQMYEEMGERFDGVHQHLDGIETKLDTLSSITINMYKTMVQSHQYTVDEFERINRKIEYIKSMTSYMVYREFNHCYDIYKRWNEPISYSDFVLKLSPNSAKCFSSLSDFLAGKGILPPFYRSSFDDYFNYSSNDKFKEGDVIDMEIKNIYNPTRNLFLSYYKNQEKVSTYGLMFPVALTIDANKPYYYLRNNSELKDLRTEMVYGNYLSYSLINEVTKFLLEFSIFYEIQDSKSSYSPQEFATYLVNSRKNIDNRDEVEDRLLKLLDLVQFSIAQQSLLAGNLMLDPIYSTLFGYSTNQNQIDGAITVLNNNKLLAANFATYVLNSNIDFSDTTHVKQLFDHALTDNSSLVALNSLIRINPDIKFVKDERDRKLYLSFNKKEKNVKILCPDFATILSNRMIHSEAIYPLMYSREKLNTKLIDLTFSKNLDNDTSKLDKFKYAFVLPEK